jgi:hypothetical protein
MNSWQPKWDIFIAHAGQDAELAGELYYHLLRSDLRVFLDKQCLVPGVIWDRTILEEQRNSLVTVVLISEHTPTAHYLRDEITHAIGLLRDDAVPHHIVPVHLGERDTSLIPYGLHNVQSIFAETLDMAHVAKQLSGTLRWIKSERGILVEEMGLEAKSIARESNPAYFANSIQVGMRALERAVEVLTQEQLRVIEMLSDVKRVRIRGCPGSGKTLIAAEKAIRLAKAGLRTLFLCHNPLLAQHVSRLTTGSTVHVFAFSAWVASIIGADVASESRRWTHLDEPDESSLELAFTRVWDIWSYDAIIVDEGQDFREGWWAVVEAAHRRPGEGTLYIFHDDSQVLLPYRATYPVTEPVLNLSRNCRNAGVIYELMQFYDPSAPMISQELKDTGRVRSHVCMSGEEAEIIGTIVKELLEGGVRDIAVLLGGAQPIETFAGCGMVVEAASTSASGWKEEVIRMLTRRLPSSDPKGLTVLPAPQWSAERLSALSDRPFPTTADIEMVCKVARSLPVQPAIRRRILDSRYREAWNWVVKNGTLILRRSAPGALWAAEIILFFERPDWPEGIPLPDEWSIQPYYEPARSRQIKIYTVSDYKGLESDAVILAARGKVPQMQQQMYVGISRARYSLDLVFDPVAASGTPFLLDSAWRSGRKQWYIDT